MKKYVKPCMVCEEFVANEYCTSTCGMKDRKYIFTCDAPDGTLYYKNSNGNYVSMGSYHDCGATHVTDGPSNYYDGFIDRNGNKTEDEGEYALIWREYRGWLTGYSGHASASLTREKIEVERS